MKSFRTAGYALVAAALRTPGQTDAQNQFSTLPTQQRIGDTEKAQVANRDLLTLGTADEDKVASQYTKAHELCMLTDSGHGPAELSGVIRDGIYDIEQISEIVINLKTSADPTAARWRISALMTGWKAHW